MRLFAMTIALIASAGCSRQPETSAATTNAEVIADQLEAKANNYAMMADQSTNSAAALALENASVSLDEQSANLRVAADPQDAER